MDKMKFESPNLTMQNIDRIAALFPNCITEASDGHGGLKRAINFEMLKQMLSPDVVDGDEAYEFTWVGKKAAIVEANKPIRKTLRPCVAESKDWDTTENLYIEGDNLEVLKLLQESYLGKVKMIYIDPPYNTGNDFIYADDFMRSQEEENEQMGMYDEDENRLFKNTDTNGRFHSDWCSMIYSRLMLARNLLTDDGVIFISIDDNEQENLKKCCDEVFGEANYITQITWEKRYTRSNNAKMFASLVDYVFVYRKSAALSVLRESRSEKNDSIYSNPDNDPRGVWTSVSYVNPATREQRPNLCYEIENPITGAKISHPTNAWKYEYTTYKQHVADKKLYWGKNGENQYPRLKKFLYEMDGGIVPANLWYYKDVGTTDAASKELATLIGRAIFDFPKSVSLIQKMLDIGTDKDSIILDFFSGSSTTAHSVMSKNAEDGGHRKFIMVQLPEPCDEKSEAYKAGYKNICEIGKERIRRAGEKIRSESPITTQDLDIGFRVLKLDDTNMKDVYYAPDDYDQGMLAGLESNIKDDRTDLDLLFGCLIDWGRPLSLPYKSEQIDGCTVHTYNDGDLIACFDANIPESVVKEIAKRKPHRAVFRDSGFASSPEKINVFEIFKLYMPEDANDITKRVRVI
jgi:adenine-specific DNA-methyltransferase